MAFQDALPSGTVIGGDYLIERLLGTGGFANTYLAQERSLQRQVAIKEYYPREVAARTGGISVSAKSGQFARDYQWGLHRFANEARILARFRHPHIVRVNRVLEQNNTAYIVMEYVEGADFDKWVRRQREREHPNQAEFDRLLPGLIDALGLIHAQGVLHRDVKPSNIYIRAHDRSPVLLDFGASKLDTGEQGGPTAAIVSRGYSPQETYATDASLQGPWTDIYGLAATMYFSLLGRAPPEATARVLNDEMIPAVSLPLRGFRPSFLAAIDWGLSVHSRHRPKTVSEWAPSLFHGVPPPQLPTEHKPYLPPVSAAVASRPSPPGVSQRRPVPSRPISHAPISHAPISHAGTRIASAPLVSASFSGAMPGQPGQPVLPPPLRDVHPAGHRPRSAYRYALAFAAIGAIALGAWQWSTASLLPRGAYASVLGLFGGPDTGRSDRGAGRPRTYGSPDYTPYEGSPAQPRSREESPQRVRPASHTPPSHEPPRRASREETGSGGGGSGGSSSSRSYPASRTVDTPPRPAPAQVPRTGPIALPQ